MMSLKGICIKYYEFGNPSDVLRIEEIDVPLPQEGELLVKMEMSPINPSDIIPITGSYANRITVPSIPGYEGVGIVEDGGPSVSKWFIGKRVLPLRGQGTWQEFVTSPAKLAIILPEDIHNHIAAQLYINPITAWVICNQVLKLKPDDILLVNACGSSIGRIFAQLSQIIGFRLIAITRNDKHTASLLEIGASYVINTEEIPLKEAVMDLTRGRGATAAIDSIGGIEGTHLAFCLQPKGTLLSIGLLSGVSLNYREIMERTQTQADIFHLRHWNKNISVKEWHATFHQLIQMIRDDTLQLSQISQSFPLVNVHRALTESRKVFLTMT